MDEYRSLGGSWFGSFVLLALGRGARFAGDYIGQERRYRSQSLRGISIVSRCTSRPTTESLSLVRRDRNRTEKKGPFQQVHMPREKSWHEASRPGGRSSDITSSRTRVASIGEQGTRSPQREPQAVRTAPEVASSDATLSLVKPGLTRQGVLLSAEAAIFESAFRGGRTRTITPLSVTLRIGEVGDRPWRELLRHQTSCRIVFQPYTTAFPSSM